ncbi:unnamed protein product, partial [Ectocarpus sp. 13 AM-2016]
TTFVSHARNNTCGKRLDSTPREKGSGDTALRRITHDLVSALASTHSHETFSSNCGKGKGVRQIATNATTRVCQDTPRLALAAGGGGIRGACQVEGVSPAVARVTSWREGMRREVACLAAREGRVRSGKEWRSGSWRSRRRRWSSWD